MVAQTCCVKLLPPLSRSLRRTRPHRRNRATTSRVGVQLAAAGQLNSSCSAASKRTRKPGRDLRARFTRTEPSPLPRPYECTNVNASSRDGKMVQSVSNLLVCRTCLPTAGTLQTANFPVPVLRCSTGLPHREAWLFTPLCRFSVLFRDSSQNLRFQEQCRHGIPIEQSPKLRTAIRTNDKVNR